MAVDVADDSSEAEVVGVTKAPSVANFWVMMPPNGARMELLSRLTWPA